jgi:hypothetical protein
VGSLIHGVTPSLDSLETFGAGNLTFVVLARREWFDRHKEVRAHAAQDLRTFVESEARQMSSEAFTAYMNNLNKRICDLVNSSDIHEKMGGITVIGIVPTERGNVVCLVVDTTSRNSFRKSKRSLLSTRILQVVLRVQD